MSEGLNSIGTGTDEFYSILYWVRGSGLFIYREFVIGTGTDKSYSILYWVRGSRSFMYRGFVIEISINKSYSILYWVRRYIAEISLYTVAGFCDGGNGP